MYRICICCCPSYNNLFKDHWSISTGLNSSHSSPLMPTPVSCTSNSNHDDRIITYVNNLCLTVSLWFKGLLQGILTSTGSLARFVGPLVVTQLFDNYGPLVTYVAQGANVAIATLILIIFNRRFIQHILTREFGVSY